MEHFTMGIIMEILLSNVKCTLQWYNVFLMIYDYQSSNSALLILYIYVSVHNVKWLNPSKIISIGFYIILNSF